MPGTSRPRRRVALGGSPLWSAVALGSLLGATLFGTGACTDSIGGRRTTTTTDGSARASRDGGRDDAISRDTRSTARGTSSSAHGSRRATAGGNGADSRDGASFGTGRDSVTYALAYPTGVRDSSVILLEKIAPRQARLG